MKTTHTIVCMHSLLCVFISQYKSPNNAIRIAKAQMEVKGVTKGPLPPLGVSTALLARSVAVLLIAKLLPV